MQGNSKPVTSSQHQIHGALARVLEKHRSTEYRKPLTDYNRAAFEALRPRIKSWSGGLRLDTGCGVGESTVHLARRFPEDLVIGVDKSLHRLEKFSRGPGTEAPENLVLVRSDLEDFWRLCHLEGLKFKGMYFFYPNPWPRPEHLMRRWPGHPVFPLVTTLTQEIEIRSNWSVLVDEFAWAVTHLTGAPMVREPWNPETPETAFERKYLASGQPLWRALTMLG